MSLRNPRRELIRYVYGKVVSPVTCPHTIARVEEALFDLGFDGRLHCCVVADERIRIFLDVEWRRFRGAGRGCIAGGLIAATVGGEGHSGGQHTPGCVGLGVVRSWRQGVRISMHARRSGCIVFP